MLNVMIERAKHASEIILNFRIEGGNIKYYSEIIINFIIERGNI